MKKALVCGAVDLSVPYGQEVKGEDFGSRCRPEAAALYDTVPDDFLVADLRDPAICADVVDQKFDEIYQFAADMGEPVHYLPDCTTRAVMHKQRDINAEYARGARKRNNKEYFISYPRACIRTQSA